MADVVHTEKQAAFLAAYAKCGNVTASAKAAKINRSSHQNWMKSDPTYQERFAEAHDQACESLEKEARRRAILGVRRPIYHNGKVVGHQKEFSDTLLIFLMKGAMPEKYRERQSVEHSGGVAHQICVVTDPDWYGNGARFDDAEALAAPIADPALPGPHEAAGVRAPLGEDLGGISGGDAGARADAGAI